MPRMRFESLAVVQDRPLRLVQRLGDDAARRGLAVRPGDEHAPAPELPPQSRHDIRRQAFGDEPRQRRPPSPAHPSRDEGGGLPRGDSEREAWLHWWSVSG